MFLVFKAKFYERRILPNSVALGANYVKVID